MSTTSTRVSAQQRDQNREEGYFLLDGVLPAELIADLRAECDRYVEALNDEMDRQGVDHVGITHRDSRYFIANRWRERDAPARGIGKELLRIIAREARTRGIRLVGVLFDPDLTEFYRKAGFTIISGGMIDNGPEDSA